MELKGIKNIIFDLGGVIMNIDQQLAFENFSRLATCDIEELLVRVQENNFLKIYQEFEMGMVSSEDFRLVLSKLTRQPLDGNVLDGAWNSMLLDIPLERIDLLVSLRKKFRLFLLSNTNKIHYDYFNCYLKKLTGKENFASYFDQVYYSFELHMIKPDSEIFEHVLMEQNLDAQETLFVDDRLDNLQGAASISIRTQQVNNEFTILEAFI